MSLIPTVLERIDLLLFSTISRQAFTASQVEELLDALPDTADVLALRLVTNGRSTLNRTEVRDLMLDARPIAREAQQGLEVQEDSATELGAA